MAAVSQLAHLMIKDEDVGTPDQALADARYHVDCREQLQEV